MFAFVEYDQLMNGRELWDQGQDSSMLYHCAAKLASLGEVRAGWAVPLESAVTCSFLAGHGHCIRAGHTAAMAYRAIRQSLALLVAAPLTKA